jgi:excisionase family DNA binding protein
MNTPRTPSQSPPLHDPKEHTPWPSSFPFDRHRPSDDSADVVYTVAEVAKLLRLSLGSTYVLVRNGTIPAKKLGCRWVISKTRFRAWLDDRDDATGEIR